jgi:ABC-type nickel/cobalt efflux system permease component RcnA
MQTMMQDMGMGDININDLGADEASSATHHHAANEEEPHQHQESAGHAHQAGQQHSHSGSLATDAMQRLIRGHIHAMGLGVLVCVLLLIVALTSLKDTWKKTLAWTFGLGAVLYPPAWIIMGFRTVELGPEAAEASIMWLFAPAVLLLVASMLGLFFILLLEQTNLKNKSLFSWAFK